MEKLKIRIYPDPVLKEKSQRVTDFGETQQKFFDALVRTMAVEDGVGLAAPQVGVLKRVLIACPTGKEEDAEVIVNPEIEEGAGRETGPEGCLSFPGITVEIPRAKKIKLRYQDRYGNPKVKVLRNFPARVVQHEMDHLDGVLLVDRADFNQRQKLLAEYQHS